MKTFTSILAFGVVFIPFAGFGVLAAFGLWEYGFGKPDVGEPVLAVIVGAAFVCVGLLAGAYSARTTLRTYERQKSKTAVL